MRSVASLVFLMAAAVSTAAGAATRIENPEAFVRETYRHLEQNSDYRTPEDIYSPRLAALFALDRKEAGGDVGRIDFDFWTNSQDFRISKVRVTSKPVENAPDRRVVIAKFANIGTPEDIRFYFEKAADGWKLDDARSAGKDKWTLSLILKYGWDDER